MNLKRRIATLAALAGCALGLAAPAAAAAPAAGAVIPHGLLPMATSWPTPQSGIVLAYPSRTAGAKPYLMATSDSGRTWRPLPAPPVRFPADQDQPDATWADGIIGVTDGTHIVTSRDAGRHWLTERLACASGAFYVDHLAIARGRVFALVTKAGSAGSAAVYSGLPQAGVLRPVRGLSVTGAESYGDITTAGTLQVDLGANFATERYWYSRDGVSFIRAPLPCPASTMALLGGAHAGRVGALCSGSPSDVGPGRNDKQAWAAPRLGGTFHPSGPVFTSANEQAFAAATAQAMTVATTFSLAVTFDAGRTWATKLPRPNGAFWTDLSFPSAATGFVVCSTVNDSLKEIATVYRTTDAGHTWNPVPLP